MNYNQLITLYRSDPLVKNAINYRINLNNLKGFRNDYKNTVKSPTGSLQNRLLLDALVNYTRVNTTNANRRKIKQLFNRVGKLNNFNRLLNKYRREYLKPRLEQLHRNRLNQELMNRMRSNANANNNNNTPRRGPLGENINYNTLCRGCNLGAAPGNRLHCPACLAGRI